VAISTVKHLTTLRHHTVYTPQAQYTVQYYIYIIAAVLNKVEVYKIHTWICYWVTNILHLLGGAILKYKS